MNEALDIDYCELHCLSNFSFLRGASHPQELVERACELGYSALAITDECSLAGVVKAWQQATEMNFKLIIGSEFRLSNGCKLVVLAPDRAAYAELSGFITLARRRAPKGEYEAHFEDLRFRLQRCLVIWVAELDGGLAEQAPQTRQRAAELARAFAGRLWIGVNHRLCGHDLQRFQFWDALGRSNNIPLVACGSAEMHCAERKALHDVLCAIRHKSSVQALGTRLHSNAEARLQDLDTLAQRYAPSLIAETNLIAARCTFSLAELRYQYPQELVPKNTSPIAYLRHLVADGKALRWPEAVPASVEALLEKELQLIEEMHYEYYFLTVYDIVRFARSQSILCQGRGSAANSVVCYCLFITEIAPGQINVLFERFISKERDEPPDIDVDFEHNRREEVIQYIYSKYSRQRAALAATVITYRPRSAIRDVGKALGMEPALVDSLAKSLAWWDRMGELVQRIEGKDADGEQQVMLQLFALVQDILGFPRHLSQHVGGFVITEDKTSDIVPLENAAMPERTIIQWDKEDLEAMGLLKVDVLALGMLTALKKMLDLVGAYERHIEGLADIPREDPATYDMLCKADTVGVFQIESRAQMSMLPRLKPRCFYDLVIQIAIVRPGPIQGDMVHPYLRRRNGQEPVSYESESIREVLQPTLGIPIFQEQAIRLAMVAAGFSGGEADQLRRAMASWGKNGNLLGFEEKFLNGMRERDFSADFAQRLFEQIKGFGGYGFPESHSASFALLCYASSWFKRHHPEAFYCALLNSQPMGFYSPAQLVQDAQRHGIEVRPVDVRASDWENTLEALEPSSTQRFALRLGLSRIKSLRAATAEKILSARDRRSFTSILDLARRAALSAAELEVLASADALHELVGHRYAARWQASAIESSRPLLAGLEGHEHVPHENAAVQEKLQHPRYLWEKTPAPSLFEDAARSGPPLPTQAAHPDRELLDEALQIEAPNLKQEVAADYLSTGLSLRPHPMALLRQDPDFRHCWRAADLAKVKHGHHVQVAGVVTGRQRPGTAHGTLFLTLEDESGNINVVVWKRTQERFRNPLLNGKLLRVNGRLETAETVIHVIARSFSDCSEKLEGFVLPSRDFH